MAIAPRKNLLGKISGNLINHPRLIEHLRERSREHALVLCIGGGEQINAAFMDAGYEIRFGPLGRITTSFEERQLARNILELNHREVQDLLAAEEISATVIIPVMNEELGTVICHVNGDLYPILAYNGFDVIEVYTLERRRRKKEEFYRRLWDLFVEEGGASINANSLYKISVIGFSELD